MLSVACRTPIANAPFLAENRPIVTWSFKQSKLILTIKA